MTALEHNKPVQGFGIFEALFGLNILLLMFRYPWGVRRLGFFFRANCRCESGRCRSFGRLIYRCLLVVLGWLVLPPAIASRKLWKLRRGARGWGIIAAILVFWALPVGTFLAIYALWFLFSTEGRQLYAGVKPPLP